jgi:hypothetical protein
VQYKDEQKVLGNDVITAQMCQMMLKIRNGTDPARAICSQELSKVSLVRQAADPKSAPPTADACFAAQWGVRVGMTQEQAKSSLAQRGVTPLETSTLKIAGKSTEQWRFETFSIYFDNKRVSAVQQYANATLPATPLLQESSPVGIPPLPDTPVPPVVSSISAPPQQETPSQAREEPTSPTVGSKHMFSAERLAKSSGCERPVATMNIRTVAAETFTITCANMDAMSVRCDGACRIL